MLVVLAPSNAKASNGTLYANKIIHGISAAASGWASVTSAAPAIDQKQELLSAESAEPVALSHPCTLVSEEIRRSALSRIKRQLINMPSVMV